MDNLTSTLIIIALLVATVGLHLLVTYIEKRTK